MTDKILIDRELLERCKLLADDPMGLDFEEHAAIYNELNAALRAAITAPQREPVGEEVEGGWIPVWDRFPDGIVLAHYRNHYGTSRTIRAQYIAPFTVEAGPEQETDCCIYSEQDDCYYLEEGWYELIDNWGDYSSVAVTEGTVTHWMPLPDAPKEKGL
jgi:hypothetical protein